MKPTGSNFNLLTNKSERVEENFCKLYIVIYNVLIFFPSFYVLSLLSRHGSCSGFDHDNEATSKTNSTSVAVDIAELQRRFFEVFRRKLYKESSVDREPLSIIHYTWPGYSFKWPTGPTQNYLAKKCHVNLGVVYLGSSYKPAKSSSPTKSSKILRCNSLFVKFHILLNWWTAFIGSFLRII